MDKPGLYVPHRPIHVTLLKYQKLELPNAGDGVWKFMNEIAIQLGAASPTQHNQRT